MTGSTARTASESNRDRHGRRAALRILALCTVAALGTVYVLAVLVSAGPITPISLAYAQHANTLLAPYALQNWQLFAPDPISEERGVVARARCDDGRTTDYVDLTTPVVTDLQNDRFFPSRESRVISNGLFALFQEDPYLMRYRAISADGEDPELESLPLSAEEVETRRTAELVLTRYAADEMSAHCSGRPAEVQLRYVLHRFPRWSERDRWQEAGDLDVLESAWFPAR